MKPARSRPADLLTRGIQAVGAVIAAHEAIAVPPGARDAWVFALAAFMMAGAQGLDELLRAYKKP